MAESKAVDGVVDELLLGDGFSIVDSTKGDVGSDQRDHSDTKKKTTKSDKDKEKEKEKEKEKKTETKKEKSEEKPPKKEEKSEDPPKKEISPSKDDAKVNGHDAKSDALLITTEEDLDLTEKDKKSEADSKEEPESKTKKESESKEKEKEKEKPADKRKQGDVWVSNITRHVKATDLKKHFSKHGKVLTAKIVTNGKSFFGYILMENSDIANKCVRSLHGSSLDGRKITVSRQRPDQRRSITERKPTVKVVKNERKPEKKSDDKEKEKKIEKSNESKKDDALAAAKRAEDRLRREIDYHKREVARLKRYLTEEQRRLRIEQQKNRTLSRDLQETESKLREERRKIDRERELFEKNQRTDRVKLENDRSMIKKELEEVKKLREYLKRKLEEEQTRSVERRPRATSPYAYSSKRFRESSGGDKSSKYVEERTRTPPSPPKLSSRSKRSPVNSFPVEKERRGPSHHYSMSDREEVSRHSSSLVIPAKPSAPAAPRNIWPSFHQEVWRMPPGSATSTPFSSSQSSYQRQSEYNSSSSSSKPSYSSTQREFSKRDHYTSSSVRKY